MLPEQVQAAGEQEQGPQSRQGCLPGQGRWRVQRAGRCASSGSPTGQSGYGRHAVLITGPQECGRGVLRLGPRCLLRSQQVVVAPCVVEVVGDQASAQSRSQATEAQVPVVRPKARRCPDVVLDHVEGRVTPAVDAPRLALDPPVRHGHVPRQVGKQVFDAAESVMPSEATVVPGATCDPSLVHHAYRVEGGDTRE